MFSFVGEDGELNGAAAHHSGMISPGWVPLLADSGASLWLFQRRDLMLAERTIMRQVREVLWQQIIRQRGTGPRSTYVGTPCDFIGIRKALSSFQRALRCYHQMRGNWLTNVHHCAPVSGWRRFFNQSRNSLNSFSLPAGAISRCCR